MWQFEGQTGVPAYNCTEFFEKRSDFCLCIPILNEGERIRAELQRAKDAGVDRLVDIILCDGGSTDGSMEPQALQDAGVSALVVKTGAGKQGAQLRCGFHLAKQRGYRGILTVDGNNKDSVESVPLFLEKLEAGFDFVQGSRFLAGGRAENTPPVRLLAVRLLHAPLISLAARQWFTDTTSAFRAHSARYLFDPRTAVFRDIFSGYELLAYLSIRFKKLGYRGCEVPVCRAYPKSGKTPTKISPIKGSLDLLRILFAAVAGRYNPKEEA